MNRRNLYDHMGPYKTDYGPEPFVISIHDAAIQNRNFRTALWTGTHLQLTLMSIPVGGDIGLEAHPYLDQFLRIETGYGLVKMGGSQDKLNYKKEVCGGYSIFIPAGTWHNLINIGNGSGVVLATGTPVTNTLSELFVMQHYLQPDTLRRMGIDYFDNWASVFGKTVTSLEVKPSGNGFRMKTRFAEFHNLPELSNIFMQVFDIKKTADLGLNLPKIEGGKPEIVVCEKSPAQEAQVEIGMQRAQAIEDKKVDRTEDNMLSVCTYMTKVALDARIIEPDAEDFDGSKVNTCARKILEADELHPGTTQVVFCDTNVPQGDKKIFSVYSAIKKALVESGKYAEEEVAFIHDATTDAKRDELFKKVNSAKIRVIIGSTSKLGTGVNMQNKLIEAHHLDAPYRPSDLDQRNGRIVRQGNENESVKIVYYSTKGM